MSFHKTTNVNYELVYDSDNNIEYSTMYDMLPMINEMRKENKKLKNENEALNLIINRVPIKSASDNT